MPESSRRLRSASKAAGQALYRTSIALLKARATSSRSACVWAVLTKAASNWLGASITPCCSRAACTRAKRVVPIARMHHFGPVWDGRGFWREAFEEVPVDP